LTVNFWINGALPKFPLSIKELGRILIKESVWRAPMTVGYALGPNDGEHLILRGGSIFIKADPTRGSKGITMLTQQVVAGAGIPIHRHLQMDEAFYVLPTKPRRFART
jgi:hypothetical protein